MTRYFRLLLAFAGSAILISCASTRPTVDAPIDGPPETISLRFGWRAGETIEVDERRETVGLAMGTRTVRSIDTTWTLATEAVENGIALRVQDWMVQASEGFDPQALTLMNIAGKLGEAVRLVVDAHGAAVRLDGSDALEEALSGTALEIGADLPDAVKDSLRAMVSPAVVEAREIDEWNLFIGSWSGADLSLGTPVEVTEHAPSPLTGEAIEVTVRFVASGRVPCRNGETEAHCVRLELESTPDAATVSGMLRRMFGALLDRPDVQVLSESFRIRAALIAEADGLIPHRFERSRAATLHVQVGAQILDPISHEETIVRRFNQTPPKN